jgi:oligopeptidase A
MPESAFGAGQAHNPLLAGTALPMFADIRAEHVEPAVRELLAAARARVAGLEAVANPSFASVVEPLEQLRHHVARTWSPVGHLNGVMNSEALRAAYNACLPLLSEYYTDLAQSEPLYRSYEHIRAHQAGKLDAVQLAAVDRALTDFRLAGVALGGPAKARFKAIMSALAGLQARFEQNVLDSTNAWSHHVTDAAQLEGLNAGIVEQAVRRAREAGRDGWLFGLDQPTYMAVVTDCASGAMRRAFYQAWSTRASPDGPGGSRYDNTPVMAEILALRHEAARRLGFDSFAAYALADRMAASVAEVTGFLAEIAAAARPRAQAELAELEAFAGRPLDAWDITFYSERLQQQRFNVSQEELREYLPLPRVLEALFEVAQRLYDVGLRERHDVPRWHPDVRYFEVRSAKGEPVASFYLDACARPSKRSGAWMDDCVGRMQLGQGQATLPVAYLVCNSMPPGDHRPAQLTHDDVVTLFHEFGHGLHHMLTRVAYPSVAGINGVAWDAVELPSQFMENYAWLPDVLERAGAHVITGAPIPAETQRQLIATRSFHAALLTLRQVEYSLFDMRLHAEYDPAAPADPYAVLASVRAAVAVTASPDWNRFPHSFSHIFAGGYAAGYYSYKWAEVLAADAFAAFREHGVFDRATALRFLDSVLSRGGSRRALDCFVEFRGRKPDIRPLLELHGIAPPQAA